MQQVFSKRNMHLTTQPDGGWGIEGTSNIDVPIHFSNTTSDFQAMTEKLKNQSLTISR